MAKEDRYPYPPPDNEGLFPESPPRDQQGETTQTTTTYNGDDNCDNTSKNFLILSDSGKPIYARHGSDEAVTRICGLLQGLRSSVLYDDSPLQLGDLHSIDMDNSMRVIFWHVKNKGTTLVAIAPSHSTGTEAYLRLVLELLYCQLTFSLTEPVLNSSLQYGAHLDLNSAMGSTERQLHALVDSLEQQQQEDNGPNALHFGALHPLYPLSSTLRERATNALRDVGDAAPDTLLAFLFVCGGCGHRPASTPTTTSKTMTTTTTRTKLVSLVQSPVRTLQMQPGDLHLLLHFVSQQPELRTSELWLPVCLPRFNTSGYLYCYTCCLDPEHSGLTVAWTSHIGTTEQFRSFQQATDALRQKLSIPISPSSSVPSVAGQSPTMHQLAKNSGNNIAKTSASPSSGSDAHASDQDYVDASGDGDQMIPYIASRGLLEEVALALDAPVLHKLHSEYLEVCQGFHFAFRYDVMTRTKSRTRGQSTPTLQRSLGKLPQILSASDHVHFDTPASRRKLWSMYDKLMMRLRLGSVQSESIQDAIHMMSHNRALPNPAVPQATCPASGLFEAAPNISGLTSVIDEDYLYVAINGEAFELYFTLARFDGVDVKRAATLGTALVRRLLLDKQSLFVCNPMTWKK